MTAKGELGKKPTVSFKTPMTVEDNSYVVLQKGDGAQIEDGDRVCSQGIAISVKDGSELASTWEKNTPDCSTVVTSDTSQMTENYYKIFKSLKLNSTVAFGVNEGPEEGHRREGRRHSGRPAESDARQGRQAVDRHEWL